ncbi:hypothetical protein Tco_1529005, partial [Tanacetum coccineum]
TAPPQITPPQIIRAPPSPPSPPPPPPPLPHNPPPPAVTHDRSSRHTAEDLSINSESTEVDAPPVNDDNANANEGNAEDDDVAHVLDDDDDVVVSDDDEVNPSTNVEEV